MSELFSGDNLEEPKEGPNNIFEFQGTDGEPNPILEEGPIVVPIGELVYHQVMTAVSSAMFHYVEVFNELGNVRLIKEGDIKMLLEQENTEEGDTDE